MSFLKRIFGKGGEPAPGAAQPAATAASPRDPASDPNMMRVFDSYGRELFITKQQWRENVLLGNLEKAKGDPDKLANMIVGALQDGFAKDVIPFAEHLHATDSAPARGATLLGVVYLDVGRPADAERILRDFLERHGEDPYVLTNLAKAQDARGDHQLAEATLWRSIQLDPNQDNGFGWYAAIRRDRAGEAGWLDACRRVAALPSSWRAQLWLARDAVQRGDLPAAISLYQESLSHAGHPAPGELLKQLSGDLGNAGHLNEIVSLVAPQFDVTQHGLEVGNNLIKANLELGRLDEAKRIIEQLYAQGRPDWRPTLEYWDAEVAKTRVGALPAESDGPLQMEILSIEGPLWLRDGSPCASLVAPKPEGAPRVLFFGSTALMPDEKKTPRVQLADGPGRLSRALPLVLAEQVHLSTAAAGVALIPWIGGKGFALFGRPYGDAELCALALKEREPPTLIGGIVLDAKGTDWSASLRLIRVADGTRLGTVDVRGSPDDPAPAVELLASRMIASLGEAGFATVAAPAWYRRPDAGQGSNYLLRLEQQLAVTCGNLESTGLEPRHHLQAWHVLRELGVKPAQDLGKQVLGVVVEVPVGDGPDVLAAYADHSARYLNHAGGAVIWERPDDRLDALIDGLLAASSSLVQKIGPWDGPRPPPPRKEHARLNFLTPSGLHFGEGPFSALAGDPMGAPVINAATLLMKELVEIGLKKPVGP